MENLNHRQRRAKAKQDARKLTCSKHTGVHLVVQGTRTICPQCYLDYKTAKERARVLEMDGGERAGAMEKIEEQAELLKEKIDDKMKKVHHG